MNGYAHPSYAASLAEFGIARRLEKCGGSILVRQIAGTDFLDAMGPYPIFACEHPCYLKDDVSRFEDELVCLAIVSDPLADAGVPLLSETFDQVRHFKDHFVADLATPVDQIVSKHHRYYARRAAKTIEIERIFDLPAFLDDWDSLYAYLAKRHGLKGIKRFSRQAFERQLYIPGIVAFRATYQGQVVGAHLWFTDGDAAYSHLAASNEVGYAMMASYALYMAAISYFQAEGAIRWLHIGAGAGVSSAGAGLSEFKRGWATETRPSYFCTRIFHQHHYDRIVRARALPPTSYFPAYRAGEFG